MPAPKEITLAAMIESIRLYVCQPEPQSCGTSPIAGGEICFRLGRCEHIPGASLCQNFQRCLHSFPIVAMH
jgi:hypothetical protein